MIGYYLGYGRDSTLWTTDETSDVLDCISSGLRQFYFPPTPPDRTPHEWSFLRPITTLALSASSTITAASWVGSVATFTIDRQLPIGSQVVVASVLPTGYNGTYTVTGSTATTFTVALTANPGAYASGGTAACMDYQLPDNFGGIEGEFTYASTDYSRNTVAVIGEVAIRAYRQNSSTVTGKPRFSAIKPLTTTGSAGQRFAVMFWPDVDATYTLSYRFKTTGLAISASLPYPLGGAAHSDTILESMLAKAELLKNDAAAEHNAMFAQRLAASIQHDRRAMAPEGYGYNGDMSDYTAGNYFPRTQSVTYNSVQY